MEIRKGALVRFIGEDKLISLGKLLSVHDANGDRAVVWVEKDGKYARRAVRLNDIELVSEVPE